MALGSLLESDLIFTKSISGDYTLERNISRVEIDAPEGEASLLNNVTITLPAITPIFINRDNITIKRIDNFANTNFIVKIVAENPTDLDETDNQILLDIFTGVEIYAGNDGKWKSTNGFSEHRKQVLQTRSTGLTINGFDVANYISVNTTAQAWHTVNILQGGEGWIYDRELDDFNPQVYKVQWDATNALDTDPPNQDGNLIIYVDKTGTITLESINQFSLLPVFAQDGKDANRLIQLGLFTRVGGATNAIAPAIQGQVNIALALDSLLDSIGTVNSAANPLGLEAMGTNLNLRFTAGEGSGRKLGFATASGALNPITNVLLADVDNVPILLATRDNVIQGSGITVNVTQYEDPNNFGTLITLTNNRAKVSFYRGFPDLFFLGEILGTREYTTTLLAMEDNELPKFPSIIFFGFSLSKIAALKNEIDLQTNAIFEKLPRVDLV
jgi:hypothetical protein